MQLLLENISVEDTKKYILEFYSYAKQNLEIDRDPKLFLNNDQKNADDMFGKTGYYDPEKEEIHLFITDRHGKDIIRSFAHELIHHEQRCLGKDKSLNLGLTATDPDYASKDEGLREMEREAFEKGNLIFRDWTDSKKMERKTIMAEKKSIDVPKSLEPSFKKKREKVAIAIAKDNPKMPMKQKMKIATDATLKGMDLKNEDVEAQEKLSGAEEREMKENKDFTLVYPEIFTDRPRVMDEAMTQKENAFFDMLVKKLVKPTPKPETK